MRATRIVCIVAAALLIGGGLGLGPSARPVRAATPVPPDWSAVGAMTQARSGATATALADGTGRVLIAGGDAAGSELFDPASGSFSPFPGPPTQQPGVAIGATATLLTKGPMAGDIVLIGGALRTAGTNSVWIYQPDPTGGPGTWTRGADSPAYQWAHTATLLADGATVLVAGGTSDANTPLSSASIYDPVKNVWSTPTTLGIARYGHAAVLLNPVSGCDAPGCSRVLVTGGSVARDPTGMHYTASSEIYDSRVMRWVPDGSLTVPRDKLTATGLPDGRVLAAGGETCTVQRRLPPTCMSSASGTSELRDPTTGAWTAIAPGLSARYSHAALLISGGGPTVLVVGGSDGASALDTTEIFDVRAGTWSQGLPLTTAREGPVAALVSGVSIPNQTCPDAVLLAGGRGVAGDLQSAELFDAQPWISGVSPAAGPAGGPGAVSISGGGLANAVRATFGATPPQSVISASATSASAVPPAHAVGQVQVSVATGQCASRPNPSVSFSYDPPVVSGLVVAGLSAAVGPAVGQPGPITVNGRNFVPAGLAVAFGSVPVPATDIRYSSATQLFVVPPPPPPHPPTSPITVDVIVTTGSATSAVTQPADQYTYLPPPTITAISPPWQKTTGGVVEITGSGMQYITGASDGVFFGGTKATLERGQVGPGGTKAFLNAPPHAAGTVDAWVVSLGMSSVHVPFTYTDQPPPPPPPPPSSTDAGSGTQPPSQPPVAPAPPSGTGTVVEAIPVISPVNAAAGPVSAPANLVSGGYVIAPGHSTLTSLGLSPVQVPSLLQLPGYAPVGAPGSSMPGAAPATVAEGAPGVGQVNPIANTGLTDFTSDGPARYSMVSAQDSMLAAVALMTMLALGSAAAAWALRRREPRPAIAIAWVDQ